MKRIALISAGLLAALLFAPLQVAADSSMDVVSPLDWSYAALNYLSKIGELAGYPDGYFDTGGDYRAEHGVALKRYQLVQAVAKAQVSTWHRLNWQQGHVVYMVADLCREFNGEPGQNPDPAQDQCQFVIKHGLIVPQDHWAYPALRELVAKGIVAERPDLPVKFPMGQEDFRQYTRDFGKALKDWQGDPAEKDTLKITLECFQNEFYDPFAPFRTGYKTLADWVCPALDYLATTGYVEGYPDGHFDSDSADFDINAMPEDCYEATQAFLAKLSQLKAAGQSYPPHLDHLADDLAVMCKKPAPKEEDTSQVSAAK